MKRTPKESALLIQKIIFELNVNRYNPDKDLLEKKKKKCKPFKMSVKHIVSVLNVRK